jgi:hypothetical protein
MKPSLSRRFLRPSLFLSAIALTASAAIAADVSTESAGEGNPIGPFNVASTDLLQTSLASITDAIVFNPSYNYSSINPTPTAADLYDGDKRGEPVIQGGTITFNLNLTTNTAGYDLTSIVTTSHHYLDEDINTPNGGRDGQNYAVSYATVAAPTTFIPITNVDFLRGDNGSSGFGKATITNMGASNVAAVRFTFGAQDNVGTRYAEIDITGTPSSAIVEQNGTWTAANPGNWTDAANWLDNKPAAGTDRTANFTGSDGLIVSVDATRTIGNLVFNNADYTLNGPASLSLATTTGTPSITVGDTGGPWVATIDASLVGSSGLNKAGNGILTLTSPIAPGPVVVQAGTLQILQTLGGSGGDYNWYGPSSTTVQSGAILSINSHSALLNLTLAGGELASSGVDPFFGYGSWSLQGDACTVTGGGVSTISAQQVDFNTLVNGFVVETGSTLEIIGSLKNGPLTKNGPGLMILAAPRTGTDNTFVNEGTLQVSDAGGSLRFRPTAVGTVNSITGDSDASLAFNGTLDLDLSAASLADGNTWPLINASSFSNPGSLTFGTNFTVTSNLGSFTEAPSGTWTLELTGAKWTFTEGDGLLEYTVTATPYQNWINTYFPGETNVSIIGESADPDGDGLTNGEEFAFALIPNSGASVTPITSQLNKTTGQFTYTRRDDTGHSYSVWTSTLLTAESWTQDTGITESISGPVNHVETVTVTLSGAKPLAAAKLFIQVRATAP